jgi:hypothetical protein
VVVNFVLGVLFFLSNLGGLYLLRLTINIRNGLTPENYAMKFSFDISVREPSGKPPFEVNFESLPFWIQLKKIK